MAILKILNKNGQNDFDNPPEFNSEERKKFFNIAKWVLDKVQNLKNNSNKVIFILLYGYFKAEKKFFSPKSFHEKDIKYITLQLNISLPNMKLKSIDRKLLNKYKHIILQNTGFKTFDKTSKNELVNECERLVSTHLRPKYILSELISFLVRNKIEIPKYHLLNYIISASINKFENTIYSILECNITNENKKQLNKLIELSTNKEMSKYKLTLLKKINQSTKPRKISKSIEDFKTLKSLFTNNLEVIKVLDLSRDITEYYANLVLKSDVYDITRKKNDEKKYLYLISFVIHQYTRYHDSLIDVFLKSVQNSINFCEKNYKNQFFEDRIDKSKKTKKVIKALNQNRLSLSKIITKIKRIINTNNITSEVKITMIKQTLSEKEKLNPAESELSDTIAELNHVIKDDDYYTILEKSSRKLQNRVSEIVKIIEFNKTCSDSKLITAIEYYKEKDGEVNKNAPIDFLEADIQDIIFNDEGELRVSLYKALLFNKIANGIKSGTLNLNHSYKYLSFDEYLISNQDWIENKDKYIKRAELSAFTDVNKIIDELSRLLDKAFHNTNTNIINKVNEHARFDKNDNLILRTPKVEKEPTNPLSDLFPADRYVSMLEVLNTVNKHTNFISAFEHLQTKYNRKPYDNKTFIAATVRYGCNIGRRISKIAKHINEYELDNVINWHFSPDNISNANDKIISYTSKLELPNYIVKNKPTHTSSDGQKYNMKGDSLNANYSYKYNDKRLSVSACTFIDSRHLLFHSIVFSSAIREAAYLIDGLMHNNVVNSSIHSTDTHGYTELIFGITHLLGFSFAPRIKNIKSQTLYGFKSKKDYENLGYKLLPERYVQTELIKKHWDDILRVVASIKLKVVSASQLFKRLSSYSKGHPLYRAIKAFGQIIKSLFILKYVDDTSLRQAIQKQLNIGENSNQFSKAVFYGNNQDFIYETKEEQEIAEGCKRLIKNAIICWNYMYLSQLLANTDNEERKRDILKIMNNGSIECWGHINMFGEFDFSDDKMADSIGFDPPKILGLILDEKWDV